MAISIDFLANVSKLLRGMRQGTEAIEDVAESLDDLAAESRDAGDEADAMGAGIARSAKKAGRSIEELNREMAELATEGHEAAQTVGDELADETARGARKAETATERVEASFKELAETARAEARKAGDDLGDKVKTGAHRASEGVEEMGSEIKQEMREAGASFSSVEDGLDSVQSLAANAFAGFGPAGLVAGAAVAVGMGLATASAQQAADAANDAKENIGDLATAIVDADGDISKVDLGARVREWGVQIKDSKEFWEPWQEEALNNLDVVQQKAEKFGLSWEDLFLGMSGMDTDAATRSLREIDSALASMDARIKEQKKDGGLRTSLQYDRDALADYREELVKASGVLPTSIDQADKLAQATALLTEQQREQEAATKAQADAERDAAAAQAEAERVRSAAAGALQAGLDSAVAGYGEFKDKETEALDPQGYVDAMQARIDATSNFNGNVQGLAQTFGLSQAEVQSILDQGVDFAPMLQSIIDSGLAPQFVDQIKRAVGGGQELLDGTPLGTTVDVDADLSLVEKKTKQTEDKPRATQPVKVDADTTPAATKIEGLTSKNYQATVNVDASVSAARAAIDSLNGRTVTVKAKLVDERGRPILI